MNKLHSLLGTLSGTEKKHITVQLNTYKKNSDASVLFQQLCANGGMQKNAFLKKNSGVNNPARMKSYLYDQVLICLRSVQAEKKAGLKIRERIADVSTLYRKALYRQCFDLITELIRQSEEHEEYEVLMELLRFKMNVLPFVEREKLYTETKKTIQAVEQAAKLITELNLTLQLTMKTDFLIRLEAASREKNREIMEINKLLLQQRNSSSFRVRSLTHLAESQIAFHLQEYGNALASSSSLQQLFLENGHMIKENADFYVSAVYNNLVCHYTLGLYKESFALLRKLQQFSPGESEKQNTRIRQKVIARTLPLELALFYSVGKFKEGTELLQRKQKDLEWYFENTEKSRRIETAIALGFLFMGAGEYSKCRDWGRRFLKELNADEDKTKRISFFVLLVINAFEQNEEREIKKLFQLIKRENHYQHASLSSLAQVALAGDYKTQRHLLKELVKNEEQMNNLRSLFEGFCWWAQAKVAGKSLSAYLARK